MEVSSLAQLLREAEQHHAFYEKTHAKHHWSDWYAAYLKARLDNSNPDEAVASANRHMEEALRIPSL